MNKPNSLRAALEAALPAIKKNPQRLLMFIDKGSIVASQTQSLCFEYHYDLNVIIIDYTQHSDTLFIPLLAWIQQNQPSLLTGEVDEKIAFEAEAINNDATDISITLKLTEAVVVTLQNNKLVAEHLPEPSLPDLSGPTNWEIYLNGEQILQTPIEITVI